LRKLKKGTQRCLINLKIVWSPTYCVKCARANELELQGYETGNTASLTKESILFNEKRIPEFKNREFYNRI
jgi:hypothetical protein